MLLLLLLRRQIKTQDYQDEPDCVFVGQGSADCTWRSVTRAGESCSVISVIKTHSLGGTREDTREKSSEVAIMKQNPPCNTCMEATRLFKSEMDGENVSKSNAGH